MAIKAPPSPRRRRVQCPKCREVVFIESSTAPTADVPSETALPPEPVEDANTRLERLEARVKALEAALKEPTTPIQAVGTGFVKRKLLWVTGEPGQAPHFSAEQGKALVHNLGTVGTQAITIRTPAGNQTAREHAEWFKAVFELAGWSVRGPEEISPESAGAGLSLAVPELPVAQEAAATYLALKAAGFEPIPIVDSALAGDAGRKSHAMALTLPQGRAA
jgi:hypothetical protein